MYDTIIVGGGASAFFCASALKNRNILILEQSNTVCSKLRVSGGGKCNITNLYLTENNYRGDKKFITPALAKYDNTHLLDFLNSHSVSTIKKEVLVKGQLFLDSSTTLINLLKKLTRDIDVKTGVKVESARKEGHFSVCTDKGVFEAKNLVIASGGISYPSLGVSGVGYEIAKSFGLGVIAPKPALIALTVQKDQFWFKELSGVSMKVSVKIGDKSLKGDILFTHRGFSGPIGLNTSLYRDKGAIEIDFMPHSELEESLNIDKNKQISTLLPLPKRFTKLFLQSVGVEDKKVSKLGKDELERVRSVKNYRFSPAGDTGFAKAEATKGGVNTDCISPISMESLKNERLYFIGEILDVTGEVGGYNLQWAYSSALSASDSINALF